MDAGDISDEGGPPEWLFELIRCPITGQRLRRWRLGDSAVGQVEAMTHRDGRSVSALPSQGLLSADGRWLYPLQGVVACLVPGEAIDIGGGERGGG